MANHAYRATFAVRFTPARPSHVRNWHLDYLNYFVGFHYHDLSHRFSNDLVYPTCIVGRLTRSTSTADF